MSLKSSEYPESPAKKNLNFAGYETSPVEDGTLDDYFTVIPIEMNKLVFM